ncbi:DEAD/DEAH box helicase family protein [Aquibacillus sp. 3ASR75-11]|uniref:DEAD/DEAH box helicase family protein n=2 Tax=Terrihalobacillus insolitus TaxID=2950438 RepID=A0A9X4AKH2_9BACI|nr:DEAD/DEAH box helicase [Terrihalobacillus insolitus]MDC3412220.1 DEAD/DEAH box helicase family protein [Terrihalobacillus insolitus]MDC3423086.1 DEAD/DEAH box helicase family protein [Terrihalobacillus insolitus]
MLANLVSTQFFTCIPSITQNPHQCRRCGNQLQRLFANIPCSKCGRTHVYCRKCIEMGRIMHCEPLYVWTGPTVNWKKYDQPCKWSGELTAHQQQAADQISQLIEKGSGELLVWAVCGAGKTEMLFPGLTRALQQGKRICIATPRSDVVRELLPRFQRAFPTVSIEALYGGSEHKEGKSQLILSTTHQLLRFARAFDVMVIDEIDAFPFHHDPSLAYATSRAARTDASNIYLTATPRSNQKRRISSQKLPTVFVPVRFHGEPLPEPTMKQSWDLRSSLKRHLLPSAFIQWFSKRSRPDRQLLIFVPTIELASQLVPSIQELCSQYSTKKMVDFVHAGDTNRKKKVDAFRAKKVFVLITTTILERGVTFPSVDVAILDAGHHVFDEAALVQIAGRAGRSPDDPTGEVVFFHNGKTDAMVHAIQSIKKMNKRGKEFN